MGRKMMSFMPGGGGLKQLSRFQQVVNVLVKHGFGSALGRIRVWECVHIQKGILRRECPLTALTVPRRVRLALEELGPTFVKLGQVLSTRPDQVPPEFIAELKELQQAVKPVPADQVRGVIETELGRPVDQVFGSFDDTPIAAASLAQVHRAVLNGQPVALKVQRPGILEQIEVDLAIARNLAALAERYSPALYLLNPAGLIREFADQIRNELDFVAEVSSMKRFARNFADDERIRVPAVYPELSTRRLITMEYIEGVNIADTQKLKEAGYDLGLIARRGAVLALKAVFEHGFFHADPHPGNIFILPGEIISLVDFGMMASLSQRDRERLAKLVYFLSTGNERRLARALNEIMESEHVIQASELEPALAAIINRYSDVAAYEMRLASILFAMIRAITAHGGQLRPQLLWLAKGIAIQEDLSQALGADFNMMELGRPHARRVLTRKVNPFTQRQELYFWLIDALDLARDVPYDFSVILREVLKGRIKIEFEHVGLEPIRRTLSQTANRLSLALIIAALLVSSSVIVLAGAPPLVGDTPLLGIFGYAIAGVLGFVLTLSIWFRSGR
ncbi:MAG: hypothetical protein HYX91_00115 [Chloroflexi bacterium]|nr:hypothetical protein [Chloroflexota bacterium]